LALIQNRITVKNGLGSRLILLYYIGTAFIITAVFIVFKSLFVPKVLG